MRRGHGSYFVQRPISTVLVLDGHDASGKTTLASAIAAALGGTHLRPFAGAVGRQFAAAVAQENLRLASTIAYGAAQAALTAATTPLAIFDRHWMTVFSVLPETYWENWYPLPPTTLCWANLPTTLDRLSGRSQPDEDSYDHPHFLSVYWKLAESFNSNVVRTDQLGIEESFASVLSWAKDLLNRQAGN